MKNLLKGGFKMKEKLPWIGIFCMFIIIIVNFTVDNQLVVGIVGGILIILVMGIRIFSDLKKNGT